MTATKYVETAADFAFTQFLASITPADFSLSEWQLFKFHDQMRRTA